MSRLRSTVGPRQTVCSRARHDGVNHSSIVPFAKHDRVATKPVAFRTIDKVTDSGVECARKINVVAVEKRDYFTRRSFEAFVDCVHLPTIFFTHPVSELGLVAFNYGNTLIRAAAI